jgi:hypothetical protein
MNKFWILLIILAIAPIIGGIYGIVHDQLTYTISPEYYTKFKFSQFGLINEGKEAIFSSPRVQVSVVGFLATWWMGSIIGTILGLFGLSQSNWKDMFRTTLKAILITIIVTFVTGLVGLTYGQLFLVNQSKEYFNNWYLPENLIDFKSFIKVGFMHNFSYLGGLIGLSIGVIYILNKKQSI